MIENEPNMVLKRLRTLYCLHVHERTMPTANKEMGRFTHIKALGYLPLQLSLGQ